VTLTPGEHLQIARAEIRRSLRNHGDLARAVANLHRHDETQVAVREHAAQAHDAADRIDALEGLVR